MGHTGPHPASSVSEYLLHGKSDPIRDPAVPPRHASGALRGVDLSGRRAVVTCASTGAALETSRMLAGCGAAVRIGAADPPAVAGAIAELRASTGNRSIAIAPLVLTDPASIERFVAAWEGPLDILVNEASISGVEELTLTPQRHELHLDGNHLGHFRLSLGLHGALAGSGGGARVVSVSSPAHLRSPFIFDDFDFDFRPYSGRSAYAQSKTANILFAVEAARRWADDGIVVNAAPPSPPDIAILAASPSVAKTTGLYLERGREAELLHRAPAPGGGGVASFAVDPANARRLWALSVELTA
jgi:NAD(P)-dependent dehydrogenase (short-subunit alcohol dehydrogenase family)